MSGNQVVNRVVQASTTPTTIRLGNLRNPLPVKIAAPASTTTKQDYQLAKHAAPANTTPTTTKQAKIPKPWRVPFVGPANTTTDPINLRKHLASHAHLANSMRTKRMILPTTIQARIVLTAPETHTATVAPPFATDVLPAHEPLQIQAPAKKIACPARVDVTKYKRVKTSATIAAAENTNLKMVPLFVCPATLVCINRKKGNQVAQNVRKPTTPTNPNKLYAKRVPMDKHQKTKVKRFVLNAKQGNT